MAKASKQSVQAWITKVALTKLVGGRIGRILRMKVSLERTDAALHELRPWLPLLVPYALWRGNKAYKEHYRKTMLEVAEPQKPKKA